MVYFTKPLSRKGHVLPISAPTLISSSHGGTSITMLTLASNAPPSPTSTSISKFDSSEYGTPTEGAFYLSGSSFMNAYKAKAIGSYSDLTSPTTPSTAVPPYSAVIHIKAEVPSTPEPLTPPISHPRVRGHLPGSRVMPPVPVSPRPFTYPSNDSSHENFTLEAARKS